MVRIINLFRKRQVKNDLVLDKRLQSISDVVYILYYVIRCLIILMRFFQLMIAPGLQLKSVAIFTFKALSYLGQLFPNSFIIYIHVLDNVDMPCLYKNRYSFVDCPCGIFSE